MEFGLSDSEDDLGGITTPTTTSVTDTLTTTAARSMPSLEPHVIPSTGSIPSTGQSSYASNPATEYVEDIDMKVPVIAQSVNDCRCVEWDLNTEVQLWLWTEPESVIRAELELVNELRQRFAAAHTKLMGLLTDRPGSAKLAMDKRHQFLCAHKNFSSKLLKALPVAQPVNVSDDGINTSRLRLPKLNVPEFHGVQEEWFGWCQSFTKLVIENRTLSDFDKFQVLRDKLKGEPHLLVNNLPVSGSSFAPGWAIVNSTYGDPVKGITRYLSAIDKLSPMSSSDKRPKDSFRKLITSFRSYNAAIENTFKENPELDVQSQFMIHLFLSKADEEVAHDWELELAQKKCKPNFESFIGYMDSICSAGSTYASKSGASKQRREDRKRKGNFVLTVQEKKAKKACRVCDQEDHKTFQCPTLQKMAAADRLKWVKNKRWCFRCLLPTKVCKKKCRFSCSTCNGAHNVVLHGAWSTEFKDSTESNSPLKRKNVSTTITLPVTVVGDLHNSNNSVYSVCSNSDTLKVVESSPRMVGNLNNMQNTPAEVGETVSLYQTANNQTNGNFSDFRLNGSSQMDVTTPHVHSVNSDTLDNVNMKPNLPHVSAVNLPNKSLILPDNRVICSNSASALCVSTQPHDLMIDGWVGAITNKNIYQLLATAIVEVEVSGSSERLKVRALLDSCAQFNLATSSLVSKVKPKCVKTKNTVKFVGDTSTVSSSTVSFRVRSTHSNFRFDINCVVFDDIVTDAPSRRFDYDHWRFPPEIGLSDLADPHFNIPAPVDLLIGTGIFWNSLLSKYYLLGRHMPRLQHTKFGWIVTGDLNMQMCNSIGNVCCETEAESFDRLSQTLERFWFLEDSSPKDWSDEDQLCEQHFLDTTTRNSEGRFIVSLPFKTDPSALGHSKTMALKRFQALERRFARDPEFHRRYAEVIDGMIASGQLAPVEETPGELCYYIPHHAVVKDSALSTKVRIVLDPTMKSSTGLSLNDILMKGGKQQSSLVHIHVNARTHKFVFTCDIKQMFLQFIRNPKQRRFQRILWRDPKTGKLYILEFTVVPFGLRSSPFEATRCLKRLVELEGENFPLASGVILKYAYVDDIYAGADTIEGTIELRDQTIALLKKAGLELSKWCSNSIQIIKDLPDVANQPSFSLEYDNEMMIKTLGIRWYPQEDMYRIWVQSIEICEQYTKRQVLSIVSSIFDPLGFIGPVLVLGKLIMQVLWADKLDWDTVLSREMHKRWLEFITTLGDLKEIAIPRYLFDFECDFIGLELHGFADASERAYGAVVYVRSMYPTHARMTLVTSRSRVAPLKKHKVTLPRLELCAAELLANLVQEVIAMLENLTFSSVRLWSDSEITLFWIRSPPERWSIFVANRVRRIQTITTNYTWDHIGTKLNPADPLSRGIKPSDLKNNLLWWNGPGFLTDTCLPTYPGSKYKFLVSVQEELKRPTYKSKLVTLALLDVNSSWMNEFSSLEILVRKIGFVCRFIWNCHWYGPKLYGSLRLHEYESTLLLLVQLAQREAFKDEYFSLLENKAIKKSSTIACFYPFMANGNVIRVGGRLCNADLSFEQKHPLLLPPNHALTKLVVRQEHLRSLHAGPTSMKSALRRNYWVVHTNKVIRNCIATCPTCIRDKRNARTQIMAALPRSRVAPQRPFSITGVDYAGPVNLHVRGGTRRTRVMSKGYIAVFVCFSTKALHLELVSDLTSQTFIAAFERFIARRGIPIEVHSDNGTTFVGAKRILSDLGQGLADNKSALEQFWLAKGVNWKFIPPYSPHFGGLWEAGVKSVKSVLKKVIGDSYFTFEEYATILAQTEACLNSRPLVPESPDPNEFNALTPGHFLIGGPITALPNKDICNVPTNRLKYWDLTKQAVQKFWKRWQNEYLNTLQERNKWRFEKENVKVDDLVLVKEESLPPTQWAMGRISELHSGQDGHTRVISIRMKDGRNLKRAINKVVLLPADE